MKWTKVAVCMLLLGLLSACGGGGGGGGQSTPNGAFILSATSLNFTARDNGAAPAAQQITLTLTGSGAAYAGAAYQNGQTQPSWLAFSMTGSGSTYQLVVSIASTALTPGTYTSTFAVGTADSAGNVLESQNVTVTLTVSAAAIGMTAFPNPTSFTMVYGAAPATTSLNIEVISYGLSWTPSSDASWLVVPSGSQMPNELLSVTLNAAGLAPGTYQGHVTVAVSNDPANKMSLAISLTVQAPTFTLGQSSITIGGSDGLSPTAPQSLAFSLDTGTAAYPFTAILSTTGGGSWLSANNTAGTVSGSGTAIQLSGATSGMVGGTYTGQVTLNATVGSLSVTSVVPVTFNIEANRIVVGAAGVGFSATASGSVLTRAVTVYSVLGHTNTPWQAISDQSWLTVTSSGVTGGAITLTANPGALAAGTYFANVTVSSSDASVENQETIRVGLYISGATVTDFSLSIPVQFLAADPVEPIVFVNNGGSTITGYNIFTGVVARSFSAGTTYAGSMVVSSDGRRLYVYDQTGLDVVELDATSGALIYTYNSTLLGYGNFAGALAYVRPSAHPMIITPASHAYDVTTHAVFDSPVLAGVLPTSWSLEASPDSSIVVTEAGRVLGISRSALGGGTFKGTFLFSTATSSSDNGQSCISGDGQTVYNTSDPPYNFYGTSLATRQGTQVLNAQPYPDAIACGWNGLIVGGTDAYYNATDVFLYNGATGTQLTVLDSSSLTGSRVLLYRGLALSADDSRLITMVASQPGQYVGNELRFQTLPPP